MNTLIQANVFFFISSVGFIILGIFVGVFLFYLVRATKAFSRIVAKAEKDINQIGDTTKEMFEEVKNSWVFNLIFGKKKHTKNK